MKTETTSERRERRQAERMLHGARMRLHSHEQGNWVLTVDELKKCLREIADLRAQLGYEGHGDAEGVS